MYKPTFTCIAATLVAAPMTTIVKAEETTIIKRDRDSEATRRSLRRGRNLKFFQFPIRRRRQSSKRTRLTQRHLISRKKCLGHQLARAKPVLYLLNPGHPPPVRGFAGQPERSLMSH